jgi:polyhydroxyalkanoate synthesis regulator phasin
MPAELGGSQISSLLESLPGIASVLRSPVADSLVKAIRAAAGVGEFAFEDAEELVRYAVRRGLIGADEGDRVLADVEDALKAARKAARGAKAKPAKPPKKAKVAKAKKPRR